VCYSPNKVIGKFQEEEPLTESLEQQLAEEIILKEELQIKLEELSEQFEEISRKYEELVQVRMGREGD